MDFLIAKTVLSALPLIDKFCEASSKEIRLKAIRSYTNINDTYVLCNKFIDQIFRNDILHNLQVKTERLLQTIPKEHRNILILYYIKRLATSEISKKIGLTQRTVFRQIKTATQYFSNHLKEIGLDSKSFTSLSNEQKWIKNIYERLSDEEENITDDKEKNITNDKSEETEKQFYSI